MRRSAGASTHPQGRTFPTLTRDLLALADGRAEPGVTPVALAATGVYWKPVFHLWQGRFEVLLVNAEHRQPVPGRQTAVKDWEGLAPRRRHGRRRGRCVPPAPLRERRDLTRQRPRLIGARSAAAHRLPKVLQDAHRQRASVATDVRGVSGRALREALVAGGTDPEALAERARKRLREKLPARQAARHGRVPAPHRCRLPRPLEPVSHREALLGRRGARLEAGRAPFAEAVEPWPTIPGVSQRVAETVVAASGTTRAPFPSAGPWASWAGRCPGKDARAGQRRRGRTPKGSRWLRGARVPAARAARHPRDTALAAPDRRRAKRRGRQRAWLALGHALLGILDHVLKRQVGYRELGEDYLERWEPERRTRQLRKRLEQLGHKVTLEPQEAA